MLTYLLTHLLACLLTDSRTYLQEGEPFEVLVYGSPGMHPGDLHKVSVCYPEALRDMMSGTDPTRTHGVFFSTRGSRSLADEIAGGDYDGDEYSVIAWAELVRLFLHPTPPYTPGDVPPLPSHDSARSATKDPAPPPPPNPPSSSSMVSAAAAASAAKLPSASVDSPTSPQSGGSPIGSPSYATREALRHCSDELAAQRDVEGRLVANYIMARFLSGGIVGTAGTQWMVFADKYGAACRQCLQVRACVCLFAACSHNVTPADSNARI